MHKALILDTRVRDNIVLWKMKVPLRIKIFFVVFKKGCGADQRQFGAAH
jgi:hypothetical protein